MNKKTTKKTAKAALAAKIREAVSRHVGSNLTEAITKDVLAIIQK